MAELYTHAWYNKKMKKVNKSVVNLLICEKPCAVYLYMPTEINKDTVQRDIRSGLEPEVAESGRVERKNLAIHYGTIHPSSPPRIIDLENSIGYEIYPDIEENEKIITQFESDGGRLFYDADKIYDKYIWKGTVEELLEEFKKAGFTIKEDLPTDKLMKYRQQYEDIHSE